MKKKHRARVVFTGRAYKKMYALVDLCKTEIAWFGTVQRVGKREFRITDILVPPQTVTGATVNVSDEQQILWEDSLDDDTFSHLRFYGHSHVDMLTYPSRVDEEFYKARLCNTRDFYIFGIFNKQRHIWMQIHDIENSVTYMPKDIDVIHFVPEIGWATREIKRKVKEVYYGQK